MTVQETSIPDSGQRMDLAVTPFQSELNDFSPLLAAETSRAELVTAIEAQ